MLTLLPAAALALVLHAPDPAPAPAAITPAPAPAASGFSPLDPSLISADARWVAHVELQRLLDSRLFGLAQEHEPDLRFENKDWEAVRQMLGFDPLDEIDSITVVGLARDEEAAVVMVRCSAVADAALDRAALHLERREIEVDGYDVLRWREPGGGGGDEAYSYLARKAGSDERLLLVAAHPADLADAVAALRGDGDSLADVRDGLDLTLEPHAFALVTASGSLAELAGSEEASQIGRIVEQARVTVGERDGSLVLDVAVDARSEEKVRQVTAILQGLMAFASLASSAEPELAELMPLLDGLQFESEGRRLHIRFEEDLDRLLDMIEGRHHDEPVVFKTQGRDRKPADGPKKGREWY